MQFWLGGASPPADMPRTATDLNSHQSDTYSPVTLVLQLHRAIVFLPRPQPNGGFNEPFILSRSPYRAGPVAPSVETPSLLESSKTDEQGSAVHEECYVGRTIALLAAQQQALKLSASRDCKSNL